nr:uncharacterized protein LOC117691204 isoform X2 [Crassostrea gigas]
MAAPFEGMASINVCPKDQDKVQMAAKRLRCNKDIHGNNQYMCVPNKNKTSLVEFCYDGIMGLEDKGNCLEALSRKEVSRHNCTSFSSGCPNDKFLKSNVFKYPECQSINTKHRCYVSDPSCPPQKPDEQTSSLNTYVAIPLSLGAFLIITVSAAIALYWFCRRKRSKAATPKGTQKPQKQDIKAPYGYQLVNRDGDVKNEDEMAQAGYQPHDRDADVKNEDEKAQAGYQPVDRDADVKNEDEKAQAGYQPDDRDADVKNEDEMAQAGKGNADVKNEDEMAQAGYQPDDRDADVKNEDEKAQAGYQPDKSDGGPVTDTPKNTDQLQLSTIQTINDTGIGWNYVMQAMMQKMKETGANIADINIDDLLNDALTLERNSWTQTTPLNPGPVADTPKNNDPFQLSTIQTITEMGIDWNNVMQAIIKKKNETDEDYKNTNELIDATMDWEEKAGRQATPSNPGPVADIPKKTAQFDLPTIETITDMRVDWNKVMRATMQKMNETGKTHANLDDLINDALALDQHSGTRTTPSNLGIRIQKA